VVLILRMVCCFSWVRVCLGWRPVFLCFRAWGRFVLFFVLGV